MLIRHLVIPQSEMKGFYQSQSKQKAKAAMFIDHWLCVRERPETVISTIMTKR